VLPKVLHLVTPAVSTNHCVVRCRQDGGESSKHWPGWDVVAANPQNPGSSVLADKGVAAGTKNRCAECELRYEDRVPDGEQEWLCERMRVRLID
jgi:hypothetical protein